MKLKICFLLFLLFMASSLLQANLRAPYSTAGRESSALLAAAGLTVISEKLNFDFSNFASESISKVASDMPYCTVNAKYIIFSEKNINASLKFITPSVEAITVKINGNVATYKTEDLFKDDSPKKTGRMNETLFSAEFKAAFKENRNEVEIIYVQHADIFETSYGYFSKSRFSTSVKYAFGPIKEWKRDDEFSAEISVAVPYKWKFWDSITGADIDISLTALINRRQKYNPESTVPPNLNEFSNSEITAERIQHTKDKIIYFFRLENDLPDILIAGIEE